MKYRKLENNFKNVLIQPASRFVGAKIEKKVNRKPPIFILGSPRSGTTLLLSILSVLPTVFAIPKQTYAFDKWEVKKNKNYPRRIDRLYREFIIRKIPKTAVRWIEKTPKHVQSLDKILDYFDQKVRIIHIIRDGRDVITSKHPAYLDRRKYWVSVERWMGDVKFALELTKKNPEIIYAVKYEDIICNFKEEIEKICGFIDEHFIEEMDDWNLNTRIKKSIHWGGKVQKLHTKSYNRWKNPEHKVRIQELMNNPEAVKLLEELNYV